MNTPAIGSTVTARWISPLKGEQRAAKPGEPCVTATGIVERIEDGMKDKKPVTIVTIRGENGHPVDVLPEWIS